MAVKQGPKKRRRERIHFQMYYVDYYNLNRLTQKLTKHARPSRAATLHALLCLACRQHGIDPLEEDGELEGQLPLDTIRRRQRQRDQVREERMADVGPVFLHLTPDL